MLNVPTYLYPRKQPGLYSIHCQVNDYRYYGESENVSGRIASHKSMLRRKIHPNQKLQDDWNLYTALKFEFNALYLGEDWTDRAARREKEAFLINQDIERVYNYFDTVSNRIGEKNPFYQKRHSEKTLELMRNAKKGIPNDLLGRKISIDGQKFPSVAEASRGLGHARKTIRARLDSIAFPTWKDQNTT